MGLSLSLFLSIFTIARPALLIKTYNHINAMALYITHTTDIFPTLFMFPHYDVIIGNIYQGG